MVEELRRATALGRLAEPEEIEGLALLLASPASAHITGAVFTIDGGVMINQG
jgi:NAD(P)-dependent dehydrogenase (short-subunit alcohol dehydrogenase family)